MRMRVLGLVFGCCFLMATTVFGASLYTVPAEYTVTECDEIIAFEVWTDNTNTETIRAWQIWFDCYGPGPIADAPCPAAGTCEYVLTPKPCEFWYDCCPVSGCDVCTDGFCETTLAGPIVDDGRADYIFYGISHQVPTENMGECPDPMYPIPPEYDAFTDGPRAANAADNPWQFPVSPPAYYLCTWHFQVSHDAVGDFVLDFYCDQQDGCSGDRTALLNQDNVSIALKVDEPLIVHVPCGQCCDGTVCVDEMSQCLCEEAGYTWNGNKTCADPCACFDDSDCDDSDPCTDDTCVATVCYNDPVVCTAYDTDCATASCDPMGIDGNCDIMTPLPDDTPCTDDGDPCTEDVCESGVCVHNPIPNCDITVCLLAETLPGHRNPPEGCLPADQAVLVRVHIGSSAGIVGHQGRIEWDPAELEFLGIQPGSHCDPTSEFTGFLADPVVGDGWVFFAAETGVPITCLIDDDCGVGQTCVAGLCDPMYLASNGDVDTACLGFNMIGCTATEVCTCEYNNGGDADACNPYQMRIVNDGGLQMPWQDCDPPCANIHADTPIGLICPDNVNVNADCDATTAGVYWDAPVAFDECGDAQITSYTCTPLAGSPACDPNWVLGNGGTFPQGSWLFEVCATDMECLDWICCTWTVTVSDQNTLEVTVQLSPVIVPGPFMRCIEFQLWTACSPLIVGPPFYEEMIFGGDYNVAGHAIAEIKIPKGQYVCIAARDPLHTLRASAFVECIDGIYYAIFKGDPFFGGNWLIGGNLDGLRPDTQGSPRTIDIVDYAIFVSQYLEFVGADTDCEGLPIRTTDPHADVNGDGFVDELDFTFISINFLESDKDTCCPDGRSVEPVGLTEVTTRQLRAWGISTKADINGDGLVNTVDMQLFLGGAFEKGTRSPR